MLFKRHVLRGRRAPRGTGRHSSFGNVGSRSPKALHLVVCIFIMVLRVNVFPITCTSREAGSQHIVLKRIPKEPEHYRGSLQTPCRPVARKWTARNPRMFGGPRCRTRGPKGPGQRVPRGPEGPGPRAPRSPPRASLCPERAFAEGCRATSSRNPARSRNIYRLANYVC